MSQDRVQKLMVEAWNARRAGRVDEAESALEKAVEVAPRNPDARVALGMLFAETGRPEQALSRTRDALKIEPNHPSALTLSALLLVRLERPEEAERFAERAVKFTGGHPDALDALANAFIGQRRYGDAAVLLERVLLARPKDLKILYSLAAVHNKLLNKRACELYEQAVAICPSAEGYRLLAEEQMGRGLIQGASDSVRKAIELDPADARLFALLGRTLFDLGRFAEAEEVWDQASTLESPPGKLSFIRGLVRILNGHFGEGIDWMRQSIQENPGQAVAYREIFFAKRVTEEDRDLVERANALYQDPALDNMARIDLAYALGKAHDNLGVYETAMGFFDEANRLMRVEAFGNQPFDAKVFEALISDLIRFFTPAMTRRATSLGQDSDLPIVVVGAMRSGTTMLDQILSSHPQVGSAGEQPFWVSHDRGLLDFGVGTVNERLIREMGTQYCEMLAGIAPNKERVVEKNPNNITTAGIIHLALPNARIVHVRRHPVDNVLSMWTTAFNTSAPYVYDREAIVFAHRQLMRLADHWPKVLPADRYLEVKYEDLILDRDNTIRKVVEFTGIEWDEACLYPERNERTVRTPSYWQVRQPLNASSIGKWKKYEPWLGAFRKLL